MTLQTLVVADMTMNQIYEPIKFSVLTRYPALRVRKTTDDGIIATIEVLKPDNTVEHTRQMETRSQIWQVNL